MNTVLSYEDSPATLRKLSYHVDDLKAGAVEFQKMLDEGGWKCLDGFRIVENRFTITLWRESQEFDEARVDSVMGKGAITDQFSRELRNPT